MDVLLDDPPRLSIKPTRDDPRCIDLQGISWPATPLIPLPSGAAAVICLVMLQSDPRRKGASS